EIYCVTFASPPSAGKGKVGSDGRFALTLNDANGAFGCFILAGEDPLGTIVFENTNATNMRGENQSSSQVALVGDVDFGAITFDVSTGKAVVVLTDEILGKKFDASSQDVEPFDFSGTWLVKALPKDKMPEGYVPPCKDDKKGD